LKEVKGYILVIDDVGGVQEEDDVKIVGSVEGCKRLGERIQELFFYRIRQQSAR
jgi:hypothetical protein